MSLTDEQSVIYSDLTRYNIFPIYYNTEDNKYIMQTTANLALDSAYSLYVTKAGDTLDTLAYKFYKNPSYYWAIADFNRIQDPFESLPKGKQLKIPVLSSLEYISLGV